MQHAERSPKESPLSVVTYEIHMLRHAAAYLEPAILDRKDHVANAWQEVYLLHYRNLIEFFTKRSYRRRGPGQSIDDTAEDMIYLAPQTWARQHIAEADLMPAVVLADALYAEHWSPISRFLQHCTDWRHELPKVWGYPTMNEKIEAVLKEMFAVIDRHGIAVPAPMP